MWKNRLKPYDLLSKEEEQAIHEQAMNILEEIGVDFLHERAREIFAKAGMKVEENRVRFDRAFILEQVAQAPETFPLQARNAPRSVVLGGDNVVTAPVYGPPFITDLERGRRGATIEDFNNFDKMAQAIDQIHCAGGTTVEPEDLPLGTRHLDMVYSHMRWTDKPFMGSVISSENARDTIAMASIVFGGREKIEKTPAIISLWRGPPRSPSRRPRRWPASRSFSSSARARRASMARFSPTPTCSPAARRSARRNRRWESSPAPRWRVITSFRSVVAAR